ncbi:MAG: 4-(cytidine 5'-diphospho)-2-C-methyl-D-erythritol kinase [Crocinitomicaceae bacterium]
MILFSNAKINLGLFILNKRPDGFHNLASLKFPVPLTDVLEILPADEFSLQILGKEVQGKLEDNLIWKAYELIRKEYSISPVQMILQKNIPMGAGLGGGSSNATFALKGLNDFFQLGISDEVLRQMAAKLGSDCPFFVANQPQMATETGTVLTPFDLSLKGLFLYLIDPQIHVSTAMAYAGVVPRESNFDWEKLKSKDWNFWQKELKNDFEPSIFAQQPKIQEIKNQLYEQGAVYASMSGSGSAVYGLFESQPQELNRKDVGHFVFEL